MWTRRISYRTSFTRQSLRVQSERAEK